jgi:hypothetical protein
MYVQVPDHLKVPLLRELRQIRRRNAAKAFPLAVLFVAGLSALVLFVKGHLVIEVFRRVVDLNLSDRQIVIGLLAVSLCAGVIVGVLYAWQICRECRCEDCLYCFQCNAVDKYDSGSCPVCNKLLNERLACFYTTDKQEQKALERWGLPACRD